jgi:hypothetical protein
MELTAVDIETLKLCREDVQFVVGGWTSSLTGAQTDSARRLYRAGLVEWKLPTERSGAGYRITEAGRAALAAADGAR